MPAGLVRVFDSATLVLAFLMRVLRRVGSGAAGVLSLRTGAGSAAGLLSSFSFLDVDLVARVVVRAAFLVDFLAACSLFFSC